MLKLNKKDKRSNIEREIDDVLELMKSYKPDSKEYSTMADNIEKLYKAKAHSRSAHVTPDTIVVVGANLAGLWMIMNFEKADILRTKALGFVMKGRV